MRPLRSALALGLLIAPTTAIAENNSSEIEEYVAPVMGWMEAERPDGTKTVRQVLPSTGVSEAPGGPPLILYINKNGVTLSPGDNDARANRSTLVSQTTAVPAWTVSATAWAQIMSCTQTMWAPYNVTVTDVDPGPTVSHMESIVTTLSSTIGMDPNVGGVSPYTIGCDYIPNSIVFTFAQAFNGDPETICEVMGQEMAHSIGLDHQMLASDPMTYLQYNGLQSFKDQTVSCGEYQNRACGLQGECGATQNSHQMLMTRVGAAGTGGNELPTLSITSPADGAQVPLGFRVDVAADDDGSITKVDFVIDGVLAGTDNAAPFSFTTATTMAMGQHTVQTVATDDTGQTTTETITVTIANDAPPQDPPDDPDGGGDPDPSGNGDPATLVSGCSAGGGAGGGGALVLLALVGLASRRRR